MKKKAIQIPFKKIDGRVILNCFINNQAKGSFILDMNQKRTVLNEIYFIHSNSSVLKINQINCGALSLKEVVLEIKTIEDEGCNGCGIYGILGLDIFQGYEILNIDEEKMKLYITTLE